MCQYKYTCSERPQWTATLLTKKHHIVKTKELSKQVRDKVIQRHKSGLGYKKISTSLMIPWSTIKSIITKWKQHGTTTNLPRQGRPPKLTELAKRALIREATQRPKVALKELQSPTANTGVSVHRTTISCTPHRAGLYGRVARKKPLLSVKHKKAHFEFAKKHVNDPLNVWRKVIWSDETKIELIGRKGKCYVWWQPNTSHHPKNTVKHGGVSIML